METKQPKQVAILAGKFKPPHAGHASVIQDIIDKNYETHVFVSPIEMGGITGKMAVDILNEYFKPGEMDRQEVFIHLADGSPVREAFKVVSELGNRSNASDFEVNVYALPEDMGRFKTIDRFAGNLAGINRYETKRTKDISGTKMREAIRNGDKESFKHGIPNGVDFEKIWNIVTEEASGTYAIPADSFETPNQYDFNIQPSQISVNLGGIPNQWTNSQPISRWDFMTNPIVQVREDQSIKYVKSFAQYVKENMQYDLEYEELADLSRAGLIDPVYAEIDDYIKNGSIGDLNINSRTLEHLPNRLKVGGNLIIIGGKIKNLPDNLEVEGNFTIYNNDKIESIPSGLKVKGNILIHLSSLKKLPDNFTVGRDLIIKVADIKNLPRNLKVGGSLELRLTDITSLPNDLKVGKNIILKKNKIRSLPDNLTVNGNLILRDNPIKVLSRGLKIKGNLDIMNTKITSLPNDLEVGGDLIYKRWREVEDLPPGLKVGGKTII